MAKVFPFRPYRYAAKAGPLDHLVSQPYDKISPEMQDRYYAANPCNIVRIIKGKEEAADHDSNNVYTRAAEALDSWIADGILTQDKEPGFFPYFQEFEHPETHETYVRQGFIGIGKLEDYSTGIICRHELTHSGPKLDRLQLARHTHAHFGQIFMLYDDPDRSIDARLEQAAQQEPLAVVKDEYGVRHSLWKISGDAAIAGIRQAMDAKRLLIADGHHRYETALAFNAENSKLPGADKVMMTFVNLRSPGLVVLATHRILDGLPNFDARSFVGRISEDFQIDELDSTAALQARFEQTPRDQFAIGAALRGEPKIYFITAKGSALEALRKPLDSRQRGLDVALLHTVLIEKHLQVSAEAVRGLKHIRYVRGLQPAVEEVRSGPAQVAFLLRPVAVEQVAQVAFHGGVMPQKSTDFYPKLLSGLTIYRLG